MLNICLAIPAYAAPEAVDKTLSCITTAQQFHPDIEVIRYDANDPSGALENALLAHEENDVFLPLFAGDTFAPEALTAGLSALDGADRVTVYGTTAAYLNLIRFTALNPSAFLAGLQESCLTLAESISGCMANDAVTREIVTATELTSLCWNVDKLPFPADKRRVWAFCAGQYSNDFRGNPKYLFLYLNRYNTEVLPYWLCDSEEIIDQVRHLGCCALRLGTLTSELAINHTGVLVSEQVKAGIPAGLENAVYLNLWHGVGGVKAVERSLTEGRLAIEIAKKYIQHNTYFRTNELYLAPSDFIEGIAREQLGLQAHQIIHSGYPRNLYQRQYEPAVTFRHDCFRHPELPEDVRFAAYIPTYRNNPKGDLFAAAIPDMEQLIRACQENHVCMIFKMHPLLENELSFRQAKLAYTDCPWVHFWDNSRDFYEVLDRMDLCIFDYSSMFTDFIAAGCRHFLRYAFDFTGSDLEFPLDYDEATLGRKCVNFSELLSALGSYGQDDLQKDIRRISDLYWKYSTEDSMERIVRDVLAFRPVKPALPTLYSFDIFDTLISRRCLEPIGIFYRVQERMRESRAPFPKYLINRYPFIRHNAELNMREYYNRSVTERNDERCEIRFQEILKRIQTLYGLNDEQTALLGRWEIQAEIEDVYPLEDTIARVKALVAAGETVVLISDMYLPGDVIRRMLAKADPVLAQLPMYLSSDRGYQKSARTLFMEVYRDYAPDYRFDRWVHTGDNLHSDVKNPRSLNIEATPAHRTELNGYETALAEALQSYDGYLVAAAMARFREAHPSMKDQFTYSYISLLFVPYVRWAMHSSKKTGKKNVYFIARDGHKLKGIADVVNQADGLDLNCKLVYASRRVWRIPSFFDHIDVGFWGQGYGNLAKVNKFSKLLKALDMDEPTFRAMFPELQALNEDTEILPAEIVQLANLFKNSEKYLQYLLDRAEKQRIASCEYLRQEMDTSPDAPCSIIEYWGRGYTQENFTRLWQHICGRKEPTVFYYSRSTLPSDEDNIRMNFTSHPSSQAFIESIFACINYKTILGYRREGKKLMPVTEPIVCDRDLFYAIEHYLPAFTADYCALPLTDWDTTGRHLIDFAISWYNEHPEWEGFTKVLANLVDSVEMYGAKTAFADPLTMESLDEIVGGKTRGQISKNISISYHHSEKAVQERFCEMFQIRPGEPLTSGWKISEENIRRNRKAVADLSARKRRQAQLQRVYDNAARVTPMQQRITLVTQGSNLGRQEYGSLLKALYSQNKYTMEILSVSAMTEEALMTKLAASRFILSLAPLKQLSGITLRPGSHFIILGDTPVSLFYTGLIRKEGLRDVKDLSVYNLTNDISMIHTASAVAARRAKSIYSVGSRTRILETGSFLTDCYFDGGLRAQLKQQFYDLVPEAEGKKLIAYAPLQRYRNAKSKYANLLDLQQMQQALGGEYFVMLNLMGNGKDISNTSRIPGFSRNVSGDISLRTMMLIADVIVADYRDTTFEAPLAGVPTFVTCGDKRAINARDSLFCPMDDMMFGVPVANTEALIAQLQDPAHYDDHFRREFLDKYLTHCDGSSAQRVIDSLVAHEEPGLVLPDLGPYEAAQPEIPGAIPKIRLCPDLDNATAVLHWAPVPNACGYEVLRGADADACIESVAFVKAESCVHRIRTEEDQAQWYRVRAIYPENLHGPCSEAVCGKDAASTEMPVSPEIPAIQWILPSDKGNRLYWSGDENCAGWRIECRYADGTQRVVNHLQVNTWEWTDRDPAADPNAVYRICALFRQSDGSFAEGPASEAASPNALSRARVAPTKFLRDRFTVAWKPVAGAKGYRLCRRIGTRGRYACIARLNADRCEYVETEVTSGSVSYILLSEHPAGTAVSRVCALEIPAVPAKPTGVAVRRCRDGLCVIWNPEEDVAAWNIRRCENEKDPGKKVAQVSANQHWWVDPKGTPNTFYRVEAVRRVGTAVQFSGYSKAAAYVKK